MRRRSLLAGTAVLAGGALARPAIAQRDKARVLRFVPQANPDMVWTTATVAINHGYMVWDTLYGVDNAPGVGNCFMMPERMARTPATEQITEYVGSGPFVFLKDQWATRTDLADFVRCASVLVWGVRRT